MRLFLFSILLVFAISTLTCDPDKVYISVRKKCGNYAHEEKWRIKSGTSVLLESETYADNEDRTNEYCLTASTNNQYSIELQDTYPDYWNSQSFIEVKGINDKIIFKQTLHNKDLDVYPLSLYAPISKGSSNVKYSDSSNLPNTWNSLSYSDDSWTSVTLSSTSSQTSIGPQYYRKSFTGIANLAAYELSLNHRSGIIAYLDGNEIYRDNMPEGEPTHSTLASGTYTNSTYHSIIRNGNEISNGNHVVAIRLHFIDASSHNQRDFDMYLGQYAQSFLPEEGVLNKNCWAVPETPTYSGTTNLVTPQEAYNWVRLDYLYVSNLSIPTELIWTFHDAKYLFNGFELYPSTFPEYAPKVFSLSGSKSTSSSSSSSSIPFTQFYSTARMKYTSNVWGTETISFASDYFSQIKISITSSSSNVARIHEFHAGVCNTQTPTSFTYPPQTFNAIFDSISVFPVESGISQCTSVNLPDGLTIDPSTCEISGSLNTSVSGTFSVTSSYPSTLTGTIQITCTLCSGNAIIIERTYSYSPTDEIFTIYDANSNTIIYDEPENSVQLSSNTLSRFACVNGDRIKVVTGSSSLDYWSSSSYLNIYSLINDEEKELILRTRYDDTLGVESTSFVNTKQHIPVQSNWKYSFPTSTPTANWYTQISSWTTENKKNSFPAASNQYQLYGKTFDVSAAELSTSSAFTLAIRYQYGILVYINDIEVFRNHVSSTATDITQITSSTGSYTEVKYRYITLPTKYMSSDSSNPGSQIIKEGSNTIGIALIANSASTTTSVFDCTLRLFGSVESNRNLDYTSFYNNMYGTAESAFNMYYGDSIYYYSCTSENYIELQYKNDKREWISSVVITNYYLSADLSESPKALLIQAKNSEDSDWTTLFEANGDLKWWVRRQQKKIYFYNNKPYNRYRFYKVATGDNTKCSWRINQIDFIADKIDVEVPNLSYTPQTVSGYKDIEFAEFYPDQLKYYYDFTVNPTLPAGLEIDSPSGVIMGTPTSTVQTSNYAITAKKVDGTTQTFSVTINILVCTGGKSLVTYVIRTDSNYGSQSYTTYIGKDVNSGTVYAQKQGFPVSSSMYYVDNCYEHNVYTVRFASTSVSGWYWPSSYTLAVDQSGLRIDLGYVGKSTTSPAFTDSTFTSYLPWQIEYSDWKVLYNSIPEDNIQWRNIDFNDNNWNVMKMSQLTETPVHQTTVYIRQEFTISSIEEYKVMNVRAKFNGGFIAYINGRRIGRFNIQDYVTSSTEANELHDENVFVKFHAILLTQGSVDGKNIFAVEHHRAKGMATSTPHIFDSTAVFGLNECNLLSDSIINIVGVDDSVTPSSTWAPSSGSISNIFDHDPSNYLYYPNTARKAVEWEIENLEKSRWNSYFIATGYDDGGYGFSFSGRYSKSESWNVLDIQTSFQGKAHDKSNFAISIGMAGFKYYRWHLDVPGPYTMYMAELGFQYCSIGGSGFCRGNMDYPSVADGEASPGDCGEGFTGYTTRKCENGKLSDDVNTEHCVYKPPEGLEYNHFDYVFVKDTEVTTGIPLYMNLITNFRLDVNNPLPSGLYINKETGEIFGVPTTIQQMSSYTIYGENPSGTITTEINIQVRIGMCPADREFNSIEVGKTAVFSCSERGSYIGSITRECRLGKVDGEWQKQQGSCTSVGMIIFLVIVVIIVVVVLVFVVIRSTKKTKVVGGVRRGASGSGHKGNSNSNSSKKKPSSAKQVKV